MSRQSETPKKRLRKDDDIYLVGCINHQILGAKLPSNRQVLSVYFYNTRVAKLSEQESARLVADEVAIFYAKARIPIALPHNNVLKVSKLKNEYRELQKNRQKTFQSHIDKEKAFAEKLDDLFDMSHKDAMNMIKDKSVLDFLMAQREKGRVGCLLGVAQKEQEVEQIRKARMEQEEARRAKVVQESTKNGISPS